ncbi:MAG: glycoside hydrolase family 57 protein [Candidatus Margulisiibacteriota bacterium]
MTNRPVSLALVWHMHQPFYKDLVTGEYFMPWVRMHAVKDYYDMVAVLDRFPDVHVTFNLVPSLLLQIEDYVHNNATDVLLDLTRKNPSDLTQAEKVSLLQYFFMANWETMVNPYPRYRDLLLKRGRFVSQAELAKVAKRFSPQELLDLQVWFNLAWFGFIYRHEDPVVKELLVKGKYFSSDDKKAVIQKQWEVMGKIIPKYKELSDRGQIELTTTPFYHPILPLLCDTNSAKEAMPLAKLPPSAFQHPEDAAAQISQAVDYFAERFGSKPAGMWPSEGSVSEAVIPLVARAGIKWLATDEGILERSLHKIEMRGRAMAAADLYQPYLVEHDGAEVAMIFRNHFLSDQIGFVYQRWAINDSLRDFASHLRNIRISLPDDGKNYLVPVILDGENAWEYYPDGGKNFLESFYQSLSDSKEIRTVRVSDYLKENPPQRKLTRLFAGSWINSNFKIWIGHDEDNLAWDYLNKARLALEPFKKEDQPVAWQELFIAEGSDWCWWYGDDHSSENDHLFDALFRKHLRNIYTLIGRVPPKYLDNPIKQMNAFVRPLKEPSYLINPVLDGEVTSYYEWLSAGVYDISKARGAMHQSETLLRDIHFGYSLTDLYIRLGLNISMYSEEAKTFSFAVVFTHQVDRKYEIGFDRTKGYFAAHLYRMENHAWVLDREMRCGIAKIIELGVPFAALGVKPNDRLEFVVVISKDGQEVERWPKGGGINVTVPSDTYEQEQWSV